MAIKSIKIDGKEINVIKSATEDYISLTDMAKSQMQEAVIIKWLISQFFIKNVLISSIVYLPFSGILRFLNCNLVSTTVPVLVPAHEPS
jgi:hypothetical protein